MSYLRQMQCEARHFNPLLPQPASAAFLSEAPLWYVFVTQDDNRIGPFQVIICFSANCSMVSASIRLVPFHCDSKYPNIFRSDYICCD